MMGSSDMPYSQSAQKFKEDDDLWSSILNEVRSNAAVKLPSGKSVVILGGSESGKTTLVAKLQGIEDPKKGCGLEYAHIEIRDEDRDDSTQLGVWVLDGNPCHSDLLKFSLNEANLSNTVVMFTVSMENPWSIIDDLHFWARALHDHIDSLDLSPDKVKELRANCARRWLDYVEPGDETDIVAGSGKSTSNRNSKNLEEEAVLPDHVLSRNTGVEIIVVITKTDYITVLEREYEYKDEVFDFIQFHIRQFCLNYGAALFYTSVKEDKNCDLLYKYLVHQIYGLPFKTPALIVEKDAVFIPAGWDNDKKMAILQENMTTINSEDFYEDVVPKPVNSRKLLHREPEIDGEDEQKFLEHQQQQLQKTASTGRDARISPALSKPSNPVAISSTTPKKEPANSERVLANFFNSLLSKKTGSSPSSHPNINETSRTDAAAELDSLLVKKEMKPNSLHNSSDC